MAINLQKGQKIDLTKGNEGLSGVMAGLGWDEAPATNKSGFFGMFKNQQQASVDCDASAILCGADGKAIDCIYFGNLRYGNGAVIHQGDNLTGAGEGDDEQIFVNLKTMPSNIEKIVFVVNIYDARVKGQHFGMIRNAFIRLVDQRNNNEICRFNLSENYNNMTGLIVGEIYKHQGEWKFNAVGQPVAEASRLDALINLYR